MVKKQSHLFQGPTRIEILQGNRDNTSFNRLISETDNKANSSAQSNVKRQDRKSVICNAEGIINILQLMRLWYLSHRWPLKAQVSLRILPVSPQPSLFAHEYGSRWRVLPKIRHLALLDGCTCAFEVSLWRTKSAIISRDGSITFSVIFSL